MPWEYWFNSLSRANGLSYNEISRMTIAQILSALRENVPRGNVAQVSQGQQRAIAANYRTRKQRWVERALKGL